jgi:hypothetical protein
MSRVVTTALQLPDSRLTTILAYTTEALYRIRWPMFRFASTRQKLKRVEDPEYKTDEGSE